MIRRAFAAAVVAGTALAVTAVVSSAATPKVNGTVGPGFTITLTKAGTKVRTLPAGRYTFVIADKAAIHNFTLEQKSGGTFEKQLTSVPFVGTKTVAVTLKKGKWKYFCKIHQATMFGFFTVT